MNGNSVNVFDPRSAESAGLNISRLFLLAILTVFLIASVACSSEQRMNPSLTMDPNGVTPLAGQIQLTTIEPTQATLSVDNGSDSWTRTFTGYRTNHSLPLLGLKPNSTYSIEVTVTNEAGESRVLAPLLQAVTDPLPDDFPVINVLISDPTRMEPGFTLLDKFGRGNVATPDSALPRYAMIIDHAGNVVWYSTLGGGAMRQLPNGNLFYRYGSSVIEIDMLGNYVRNVSLNATELHHDLFQTVDGTLLSLGKETVVVDNFPTSYTDPMAMQTADVRDEPVIEFSSDGKVLKKWMLTDIIAPTRIGYDSLNPSPLGYDWVHNNAVVHDPGDDSITVSLRHQDAVIKFSRSTGELIWILGNHDNWPPEFQPYLLKPVGAPFEWPYHQHAQMITAAGTVLLFDNGNLRASPFDGRVPLDDSENYSRAVEYAIAEDRMEIRQVWEYGALIDQKYFSVFVSDADALEQTGNILITSGGTTYLGGESSNSLGLGQRHTRIIEVDHITPAVKVFEMELFNPTPESYVTVYRAERIPDLYGPDAVLN